MLIVPSWHRWKCICPFPWRHESFEQTSEFTCPRRTYAQSIWPQHICSVLWWWSSSTGFEDKRGPLEGLLATLQRWDTNHCGVWQWFLVRAGNFPASYPRSRSERLLGVGRGMETQDEEQGTSHSILWRPLYNGYSQWHSAPCYSKICSSTSPHNSVTHELTGTTLTTIGRYTPRLPIPQLSSVRQLVSGTSYAFNTHSMARLVPTLITFELGENDCQSRREPIGTILVGRWIGLTNGRVSRSVRVHIGLDRIRERYCIDITLIPVNKRWWREGWNEVYTSL